MKLKVPSGYGMTWQGCIYEFGGLDPYNEDHNSLHKWTPGAASFEEVQAKGRLPPARCVQ